LARSFPFQLGPCCYSLPYFPPGVHGRVPLIISIWPSLSFFRDPNLNIRFKDLTSFFFLELQSSFFLLFLNSNLKMPSPGLSTFPPLCPDRPFTLTPSTDCSPPPLSLFRSLKNVPLFFVSPSGGFHSPPPLFFFSPGNLSGPKNFPLKPFLSFLFKRGTPPFFPHPFSPPPFLPFSFA